MTGISPVELLMSCKLWSHLNLLLSYTIKLEDGRVVKPHLHQTRKTLQLERQARGEPKDLLVEPTHPLDKPCSRARVPVSPGEPEGWDITPDLPEQPQDRVDKQIEQDTMVPSQKISTEPETHVESTGVSNLGANKGVTPVHRSSKRRRHQTD